jgi:hypothetical protein
MKRRIKIKTKNPIIISQWNKEWYSIGDIKSHISNRNAKMHTSLKSVILSKKVFIELS